MGILDGNPKNEPMHYGEVTAVWSFIGANNGLVSGYEAFINHAEDADLINLLEEAVKMMKAENKEFGKLLKANGVTPPPALPERPKANPEEIPAGARFMDPEISAAVSINVGQGLVSCSMAMGQCIREDIAVMFAKCHMEKTAFGAKLLELNKSKGWIIPPPLHLT
ncbi:DUF3231 family protein [Sporosarcina cascadiensis]|uniref:DUF3231 family protein n=1 Tax=Sporosarcina cascadiensis TaxID=2660747 RepID=UPI00129A8820|nr:DUF3231 family protein [Sporosarcina cascadiensis]